jgi:hypothetical protein
MCCALSKRRPPRTTPHASPVRVLLRVREHLCVAVGVCNHEPLLLLHRVQAGVGVLVSRLGLACFVCYTRCWCVACVTLWCG